MADTTVTAKFRADTSELSGKLNAVAAQMTAMEKKFSSVSQGMMTVGKKMTAGVTLPIVGIGAAAVAAGANYEKSMNKVRAVTGATGSDFTAMSDTAKELGRTTQFSASQAADGMSFLAMAGFEANQIVGAMPGVLNLAAAGQMDLAQAADIASNILTGFGKSTEELDHTIDVMAKTFTSANTDLSQLGEAMSYLAPVAASTGANFEEASAAVGLLGNAGIQGSRAGTALSRVMSVLVQNADKTSRQLEELGVSALDSSGNLKPLNEIIRDLEQSGATTADIMGIFGQRAGPAMAALISQGSDALVQLTDDLKGSGGTAQEIADTQMEGFAGSMLRLKSAFEGAMIAIAESGVLDTLTSILETAANGLSKFTEIWGKIPGPVKTVTLVLAGFAAALGPVLWAGGKTISMIGAMGAAWLKLNARVKKTVRGIRGRLRTMEIEIKTAMIKSQTRIGALGAAASVMGKRVVLAFRTIGTAAKGLIASFGPIGLALTGITIALEVFMSRSAESEAMVDSLKDSVDETTGAFTDLSAAMVAEKLRTRFTDEEIAKLEDLGLSVADMTVAVLEGGDAFDEMNAKIQREIDNNSVLGVSYNNLGSTLIMAQRDFQGLKRDVDSTRDAMKAEQAANEDAAQALANSSGIVQSSTEDFGDLETAVEDTRTAMDKVNEMFTDFDANVAAIRAKDAAAEYMRDLDENLGKVAKSLFGEGKAAQRNRDVVLGAFEAKKKELTTWAEATGATTGEVEQRWREMTQEVYDQLIDAGLDSHDLAVFLGQDHIDVASVNVRNIMKAEVEETGKQVGKEANEQGENIGRQLTNGLIAGIEAGIPPMERAMSSAARAAEYSFKHHSEISSPSKVFTRLGKNLVDGVVEGLESGREDLAAAAGEAFTSWFEGTKTELESQRDEMVAIFDDMAANVSRTITSALNFSAAAPEFDEEGNRVGASFTDALQAQANKARHFAERVKQLVAQGLSPEALQQVLAAGVNAGTRIADELIAGGSDAIYVTNELVRSTNEAANKVGQETANTFYGTGVQNAQNQYDGFKDNFGKGGPARKAMMKLMDRLAKDMERTSTITVKVVREETRKIIDEYGGPRARGGPISAGTAYLVGERGPELFVSDRAGQIIPNMDLGSRNVPISGGGTGGGSVTNIQLTVNAGMGTDGAEVGKQIVESIKRFERTNGPVFAEA